MSKLWWMRGPLREEVGDGGDGGGGGVDGGAPPNNNDQVTRQLQEQKAELDRLKNLVSANVQPRQQQQPPAQQQPDRNEIEKTFWKNPLDVTNALAQRQAYEVSQQVVNNMFGGSVDTLARVARDQARNQDPELYDQLEAQIEAKMAQLQPQFKMNAAAWINAFNMAKGENYRSLKPDTSKNKAPAIHVSSPAQSSSVAPPVPKAPELTAEEKAFAKKFKMSEEDYAHGKKLLDDQDNAFGQVVTFDSFEAKLRKQREKGGKAA